MKKILSIILLFFVVGCTTDYSRPQVIQSVYKSSDGRCLYHIQPEAVSFYGNCEFTIGDTVVISKK